MDCEFNLPLLLLLLLLLLWSIAPSFGTMVKGSNFLRFFLLLKIIKIIPSIILRLNKGLSKSNFNMGSNPPSASSHTHTHLGLSFRFELKNPCVSLSNGIFVIYIFFITLKFIYLDEFWVSYHGSSLSNGIFVIFNFVLKLNIFI